MTATDIAIIAQPVVAAGQLVVVWYGIRAMIGANDARAAGAAEAARRADERHAEAARRADERHAQAARRADERHVEVARRADERHVEAMRRIDEAARQADQRHAEWQAEFARRRAESDQRHTEAMASLRALIERTAPARPHDDREAPRDP